MPEMKISDRAKQVWTAAQSKLDPRNRATPLRANLDPRKPKFKQRWSAFKDGLGLHYPLVIFIVVAAVCLWALCIGLWRVPGALNGLITELENNTGDPVATRSIITAMAALIAGIAIFGTIIVQSIRVWTNERQTRTIEQGHVTDRLTKAIEQLGAEKTTKRIEKDAEGRDLRDDNRRVLTIESTEPNLEVRLGAIYALERIASDSARDHVTIMEILCAYIRENAKASDVPDSPFGDPEGETSLSRPAGYARRSEVNFWIGEQKKPRVDIQAALTVVTRRTSDRERSEQKAEFSFDLSQTNLRRAALSGASLNKANLRRARMEGVDLRAALMTRANLNWARMEGANLRRARMEKATLIQARMEGATLTGARMQGADLRGARMEGADLRDVRMEEATLTGARMQGADLRGARMEGANLSAARMEGADLRGARMKGANLRRARMEGADLRFADFRSANWARTSNHVFLAQFADFRASQTLTQALLENLIGNEGTLLPEGNAPDTGEPWYIWTCWETPPPNFDAIIATVAGPLADDAARAALRAQFLCGPDNPRRKTGTQLAADAPYPPGHPLVSRN